jgi:hypothetical protein
MAWTCMFCSQQHPGSVCPDNLVVCCMCFMRVPKSQLMVEHGKVWNVCKECEHDVANISSVPPESGTARSSGTHRVKGSVDREV